MTATEPRPADILADEEKREEAKRQAESSGIETALDGAEAGIDLLGIAAEAGSIAADAAGATLEGVATVAKASVEVVGGILGGLADL